MPNKIHAFKDRDVRRLVKAVRKEGINPNVVEIDLKNGRIRASEVRSIEHATAPNEWDQVYDGAATATVRK
jgi:hypothetical protein